MHFSLLLDSTIGSSVDVDGQERQEKVRVRLQECTCPCCSRLLSENLDYSYSGYDSDYEHFSDNDYDCEEEGEVADIAEDYESQRSKRSNKRNQKISNKKELRRIKVVGKNCSKNPRNRFVKHAVAARAAKRDEQIAVGALHTTTTMRWEPRLAGRPSGRRNQPWPHQRNQPWSHQRQYQRQHHEQQRILPAEHLLGVVGGDNGDAMYRRLLEIANGAEITPEDYDLLLLLDEKNVRSTLQVSQVEQFELLVIDDNVDNDSEDDGKQITAQNDNFPAVPVAVSRQSLGEDSLCLICLQPFAQLENGFELRRLPCQHVYCRSCIEPWLAEFDAKCPNLSCFWNSNDNTSKSNGDTQNEETAENHDNNPSYEGFISDETNA